MKILIAASSLEPSDAVLAAGAQIAQASGCRLTMLHVIKDALRRAEAQAQLERAIAFVQQKPGHLDSDPASIQLEARVRVGHPAEEIVNEAVGGNYSLIVIGTWPAHHLWHRLLAPTTERVLLQAPCPVLIAKGKPRPIRHILLCVSGANNHSKAARFLASIFNQMKSGTTITVLHVMSQVSAHLDGQQAWQLEASAESLIAAETPEGLWLSKEIAVLRETGALIQPKVRHGIVVDELLMETLDGDYDLLVIGAHRQAGWQRYLLDDLSHQIITRADRMVLVV